MKICCRSDLSFIILTTGGNIYCAYYHPIKALIPRVAILILLLLWKSLAYSTDKPEDENTVIYFSWEHVIERLEEQHSTLLASMENIRDFLLERTQNEDVDFVERLYLKPPEHWGYQILPVIKSNPPLASISPRTQTYSLENLQKRFETELSAAVELTDKILITPSLKLEPLVIEFERLRWHLRNMNRHLAYHIQWQQAAAEQVGFYIEQNRIAASIHEMIELEERGGSANQIAALRQDIEGSVSSFNPTAGLAIKIYEDGSHNLPVTVYTDIDDKEFLQVFRKSVEEAFSNSVAARKQRFKVSLIIHQIPAAELYPKGPPIQGSEINIKQHIAQFPAGVLILTTGGASTLAWVGRNITLGPSPINQRTLAHEFSHLLGFRDAYLRSYKGDPKDHYGVVFFEWKGLIDNLMGSPSTGRVTEGMIEKLIDAYGGR